MWYCQADCTRQVYRDESLTLSCSPAAGFWTGASPPTGLWPEAAASRAAAAAAGWGGRSSCSCECAGAGSACLCRAQGRVWGPCRQQCAGGSRGAAAGSPSGALFCLVLPAVSGAQAVTVVTGCSWESSWLWLRWPVAHVCCSPEEGFRNWQTMQ